MGSPDRRVLSIRERELRAHAAEYPDTFGMEIRGREWVLVFRQALHSPQGEPRGVAEVSARGERQFGGAIHFRVDQEMTVVGTSLEEDQESLRDMMRMLLEEFARAPKEAARRP